jgi:hypothetical protein
VLAAVAAVMPPAYSDSVRCTIETCLRASIEPVQIASEVRVSHQWVYQLRQVLDAFGTLSPPHLGVQGLPRKITVEAGEGLLDFIHDNPSAQWLDGMDYRRRRRRSCRRR